MTGVRWSQEQLDAHLKARNKAPEVRSSTHIVRHEKSRSLIEVRMQQQLDTAGITLYMTEYFHIPGRDFRLDFAWPARKIGIEVQGGDHRIKGKFKADIEKRALGLLLGWRILEVDGSSVRDGRAIEWAKELLK